MKLFCIILICSQWLPCIIGREQPQLDCPEYVPENEGVKCLCSAPQHVLKPDIKWLHHTSTPSPFLYLINVRRWKNDTKYTCLVTGNGYQGSTDYILRVAYGPSVEHLTVRPSTLVTNGSQKSNLTCNATDVYPAPKYQWSGIKCENTSPDNMCTFTPNPVTDDRKNVTCTAVGSYGDKFWKHPRQASKQLQLNLTHPPPKKPTIYLKGRDYIQQGDALSCTVKGGQPLVDSVHFHCTNPDLRGEDEERSELSVSSSVTVTSAAVNTTMGMTCLCNASWNVRPEYYMLTSTAVYLFARVPRKLSDKALEMTNDGVSFTLEANPVPDTFRFVHLGNQLPDMETNMSDRFTSECTQKTKGSYFVTCTVTPLNISELLPGFYKVSVSNELGSVDVTINNGDQTETTYASIKVISGVSVAWLLVVAVVVVTIAVVKKRSCNNQRSKRMRQNQMNNDLNRRTSESTGRSSSNSYEEIDEGPGTVQQQHIPPRQEYIIQDRQLPHLPDASVFVPRPDATESPLSDNQPDAHQQEEIELRALGAGTVLTDAGIPISVSTQTEQLFLLSEPLLDGPGALRFDATESSLTDNQSDAHQQEEIEMRALGARHPYENSYTPLQRTSDTDYHRYSDLK